MDKHLTVIINWILALVSLAVIACLECQCLLCDSCNLLVEHSVKVEVKCAVLHLSFKSVLLVQLKVVCDLVGIVGIIMEQVGINF